MADIDKKTDENTANCIKPTKKPPRKPHFSTLLMALGVVLVAVALCTGGAAKTQRWWAAQGGSAGEGGSSLECTSYPSLYYPVGKRFSTEDRRSYQDGALVLVVPRMQLEKPVLGATDDETLKQGIGLYEYSPLPSWGNPNVCIAGHRGVYGSEFYALDTLQKGDYVYLYYNGYKFIYRYRESQTVDQEDWSLLFCTEDESLLTLTTCEYGNTTVRLIATCQLEDVVEEAYQPSDSGDNSGGSDSGADQTASGSERPSSQGETTPQSSPAH